MTGAARCRRASRDLAELTALLAPLRELGKGVIAVVPGEKVKHHDLYPMQREIGRPLTWTALLTVKGTSFASDMAALNARERGDRRRRVAPDLGAPLGLLTEHGRAVRVQHGARVRRARG